MTDITGKCFVRTERGLAPADVHADEWLGTLPFNREVIITVRQPRSPRQHRWFFAMLAKVLENTERFKSVEHLRGVLLIATGNFDVFQDLNGEWYRTAKSMSYASMDGESFRHFIDACLDQIQMHLGIDAQELMREVNAEEGWSPHDDK